MEAYGFPNNAAKTLPRMTIRMPACLATPEVWFQPLSLILCLPQEFAVSPLTLYLAKRLSHKDNCGRSSVFVDKIQKTKVEEFHVSQESDDAP